MKLTKAKLKQIIKESLGDEMKTKLFQLYFNPDHRQQAIELSNSLGTPIDNDFFVGVNLRDAYLKGADLGGVNLKGAYLKGADLGGANLSGADLSGADLFDADLSHADLSHADLSGANLENAYALETDLSNSNLTNAILNSTAMYSAILQGANMKNITYDKYTSFPPRTEKDLNLDSSF